MVGARALGLASTSPVIACAALSSPGTGTAPTPTPAPGAPAELPRRGDGRVNFPPVWLKKHSSLCVTFRDQVWLVASWHSGCTWRENDLLYYSTWRELAFQLGHIPQGWQFRGRKGMPRCPLQQTHRGLVKCRWSVWGNLGDLSS